MYARPVLGSYNIEVNKTDLNLSPHRDYILVGGKRK